MVEAELCILKPNSSTYGVDRGRGRSPYGLGGVGRSKITDRPIGEGKIPGVVADAGDDQQLLGDVGMAELKVVDIVDAAAEAAVALGFRGAGFVG